MPLVGSVSYLPVLDSFAAHWSAADAALGAAGPLVLPDGLDHAGLLALRAVLETRQVAARSARMDGLESRLLRDEKRDALLVRLVQFNGMLRVAGEGTFWPTLSPAVPARGDGMGTVMPALEQAADAWERFEAENPAFTLAGGYARADFAADVEDLRAAYSDVVKASNALRVARGRRGESERAARNGLSRYRAAVAVYFAEGSPVRETLPRLTPKRGHTPDAPVLRGAWDAEAGEVALEWTPPEDKSVVRLELRATEGPEYDSEEERVLATFPLDAPPLWRGPAGLAAPGDAVSLKLYAVTEHGNEKGSQAITVARPKG